jgi:AmmeMemoRadiSam system protein A
MSSGIPRLRCVFCGEQALYTTMYAAKSLGANRAEVTAYTNSGAVSGDTSRVVGYGAAVFSKTKGPGKSAPATKAAQKSPAQATEFRLSETAQKQLLSIARQSIEYYLKNKNAREISVTDPELLAPAAVFVTLTEQGSLRGCIGTTEPRGPLYEAVNRLAVAAAVEDPRFRPVGLSELKDVHIEISVLSPLEPANDAGAIVRKKHGVVVRSSGRSGLFLPQVWEHFSSKEDFLGELCEQKAGLSRTAWKDPGTQLFTFTVFAFEE